MAHSPPQHRQGVCQRSFLDVDSHSVANVTSAITAILIRANLPLSVALVWISNPLTIATHFLF